MQELAIAKMKFDPERIYSQIYKDPFEYLEKVTVTHSLVASGKSFMVLAEVVWKCEPKIEMLEKWRMMSKDKGWFLFKDVAELSRVGNTCIYMSLGEHMSFYADIMEMLYTDLYCFFEFPIVYKESEIEFQVVGKRKNIKKFVDMLSGLGIDTEISNIRKYHIKGRTLLSELTEKQYECMKLAVSQGYFDIPRRANLRPLARKMKITHGAFSFHLRKAQRAINKALFG